MNDSISHHILLVGLQNTGKTSFLAALWCMVDQSNVDCGLVLEKLEGDRKYLNQIRDAWLDYKPVPRNKLDFERVVSMFLKDRKTGRAVALTFPDLSGESFSLQWTKRQLTIGYDKLMRQATGGILFVHPEVIVKPHRIDTVEELASLVDEGPSAPLPRDISQHPQKAWDIEKTPTQVQIVELLQIMSSRDYFRAPFRLAVLVSAFDLLSSLGITPEAYISHELPLLKQFLLANNNLFEVSFYGISAQGGRYASPLISGTMLKDVKGLTNRLVAKSDPLSSWIWEQSDDATQTAFRKFSDSEQARILLVEKFNELLTKANLFEQPRFASVVLRPATQHLLSEVRLKDLKTGIEVIRLNRMLLEDAYPSELSQKWQYHEEQSKLEKQLPAYRVTVVGPNVQDAHDLTEPIQWLML